MTQCNDFNNFGLARDLQAIHSFYVNVQELTLWRDPETCHIYEVTGGGFIGYCLRDELEIPGNVVLTLVTDDVDGVYARLVEAGVLCNAAPKLNDQYGICHFYAKGPSVERVEVQRFVEIQSNR